MSAHKSKRPTMSDIAELAGVGIATVDRVLTGRRQVREENARRVYEAAIELGYHATPVIRYRLNQTVKPMRFGFVLPKETQPFYVSLRDALADAVERQNNVRGTSQFRFAQTQNPKEHAELVSSLSRDVDVIAASLVNHESVTYAVKGLSENGIPVVALLNDFAGEHRKGFVGLDNFRAGRLAGWLLAQTNQSPGTVVVLIGGNLWQAHQLRENGLRSYFREHANEFTLRDSVLNLETRQVTRDVVTDLVSSTPDLKGIYVTGGGAEGAIEALRETIRPGTVRLVVHPLTDETRQALSGGWASMIIGTSVNELAQNVVQNMIRCHPDSSETSPNQTFLHPQILLPEYS